MKKLLFTMVTLLLSSSGFSDIGDIFSMTVREDGDYDVICKSGAREVTKVEDIASRKVCGGGSQNTSEKCVNLRKIIDLADLAEAGNDQLQEMGKLNKFVCDLENINSYPSGQRVISYREEWVGDYLRNIPTYYYPSGEKAYRTYVDWVGDNREILGDWYYPNGQKARDESVVWSGDYRVVNVTWYYPNGNRVR